MRRAGRNLLIIDKTPPMRVEGRIYAGPGVEVEESAASQLAAAATLPGVRHAVATPDIHPGFGVPIGAVIGMKAAVIPAAVGYDINCGMRLLSTPLDADDLPIDLLVKQIMPAIPLGEGKTNIRFAGKDLEEILSHGLEGLIGVMEHGSFRKEHTDLADGLDLEIERGTVERVEHGGSLGGDASALPRRALERGAGQFATLGGGNHFIEIQKVTDIYDPALAASWGIREGQGVIMLHSGSRGLGHETGGHFMKLAAAYDAEHGLFHPGRDLAWLPADSPEAKAYMGAMNAAANFAYANRHLMAMLVRRAFRNSTGLHAATVYDVSHNMAGIETHGSEELVVHRKGATRAAAGQPVLIPGSMGTASYLLAGEAGSSAALCSVNHGAGRVMSRSAAGGGRSRKRRGKGRITFDELMDSMRGIRLVAGDRRSVLEEAPMAYKDIEAVIDTVTSSGFARRVARMRPLAVLKG
jgi:tRNA-splicing ligase RtcB